MADICPLTLPKQNLNTTINTNRHLTVVTLTQTLTLTPNPNQGADVGRGQMFDYGARQVDCEQPAIDVF